MSVSESDSDPDNETSDAELAGLGNERGRFASWLFVLTAACLIVAAVASLGWAVLTAKVRPLDGVEGPLLHEAMRMRAKLALYIDPVVGTADVPPSRYYVLYFPVWSALLSRVQEGLAPLVGRSVAGVAFVLSLLVVAKRSRAGWLGLLFALGFFPLVLFGAAARPDSLALLVATIALALSMQKGSVSTLAGGLFALAVFIKPNMMGLAAGVVVVSLFTNPRATLSAAGAGLLVAMTGVAVLSILAGSDGRMPTFLLHLLRSTGQAPSMELWREQMIARMPFVAAPLLIAAVYAWPVRREPRVRLAFAALFTSTLWALVSLAKIGSASNYWMEPAIAAIASVTAADSVRRDYASMMGPRTLGAIALLLFVQSIHNGVAAVRSALERIPVATAQRIALDTIRDRCRRAPGDVIIADEAGIGLELQGRVVWTPYQMANLFARGRLPRDPWLSDLLRPEVKCLVVQGDELEREIPRHHLNIDPEVKRAMNASFVRESGYTFAEIERRAGYYLYVRRSAAP